MKGTRLPVFDAHLHIIDPRYPLVPIRESGRTRSPSTTTFKL